MEEFQKKIQTSQIQSKNNSTCQILTRSDNGNRSKSGGKVRGRDCVFRGKNANVVNVITKINLNTKLYPKRTMRKSSIPGAGGNFEKKIANLT